MSEGDKELPRRIGPGDVLAEKYRVEQVLGEGGMGQVLLAVHLGLDQKVAVKALLPAMGKSRDAVTRFTREAKALARLQSEHVARVFDVGTLDNGLPYMVMEFLDGSDLAYLVDTRGPMPIADAAELALQACAGLAEVHAAGIIHRDLKPSNVYVVTRSDGTPCVKLLDFGISKMEGAAITRTAAIMGSPGYMSPEQMRSTKDVDERTDVWALGAILYEMLTGEPAFAGENAPALCMKIAESEPDPPSSKRADLPADLERVVLTCMTKDLEKRYPSVAELARALGPFAPERARPYVEKVEGILRGARSSSRTMRARNPAPASVHERVTVRATPGAGRDDGPKRADNPAALAKTAKAVPGGAPPPVLPIARPPRGRGRLVVFAMGSILGAVVVVAYLGNVQKLRAHIAGYTGESAASALDAAPVGSVPTSAAPDPSAAASLDLDASNGADGTADADIDDIDEDEDEDAAAPASAAPNARPSAPVKRKPRPNHPTQKRHRRR
jgi:eukaryotic-like serine/threonine-protein kinase